jgi:hypothetical protein
MSAACSGPAGKFPESVVCPTRLSPSDATGWLKSVAHQRGRLPSLLRAHQGTEGGHHERQCYSP